MSPEPIQTRKSFRRENIERSDLKAAFLALAAKFGYVIAFDKRMVPVRKAILCMEDHGDLIHYIDLPAEFSGKILIDEQKGVAAIRIEDRGVIIPWPSHPLSNFKRRGSKLTLEAKIFEFPIFFEAIVDLKQLNR